MSKQASIWLVRFRSPQKLVHSPCLHNYYVLCLLSNTLPFIYERPFPKNVADIIEPRYEISNNVVCATSKASDQPAHMRSLIRVFANGLNILRVLSF